MERFDILAGEVAGIEGENPADAVGVHRRHELRPAGSATARLTLEIYRLIQRRGLTQAKAGAILGIKQPHVSSLMRGQSGNFSVGHLMDFLTALGQDVEITVRPTRKEHGDVSLVLAGCDAPA